MHGQLPGVVGADWSFDTFLARLGERDRQNIIRHLTACETTGGPAHATLWKRLAAMLGGLASHAVKMNGLRAIQFFAADGKHRKQMFALEDARDGLLQVYAPDVLKEAQANGLITRTVDQDGAAGFYEARGQSGEKLMIESLTAAGTTFAPDFYRHMLGWNRSAVRITLPISASEGHVKVAESLCALAVPRR
jgi:hypothetical protein